MKTEKSHLPSSRKFVVAFIEGDSAVTAFPSLSEILDTKDDDLEWKYALQEQFDKVLDLKKGDRLILNFNRDNQDSSGYIKRTA